MSFQAYLDNIEEKTGTLDLGGKKKSTGAHKQTAAAKTTGASKTTATKKKQSA